MKIVTIFLIILLFFALVNCGNGDAGSKSKDFNVVLMTLDTTRSDYVDTGKGAKAFTPALKRFARKSTVFERAFCTIPQTLPSHLSVLTSYYPHQCGVYSNHDQYDGRYPMLQQVLKENGYFTAGVISLGTLSSTTGIAEGFDEFRENLNEENVFFTTAERVTREAEQLLNKIKKEKFFLFLHYSDPHSPYSSPDPRFHGRFAIYMDGQPLVKLNAHQGAILRKQVDMPKGHHTIRLKVETFSEDFDAFVIRRLKFSKNCTVSFQNMEFSKKYYGGSHLLRGEEGVIRVNCTGRGSMEIFQIIPLLTWRAAIDHYRREVEYMDRWVGKFLGTLEKERLLDRTLVVITGDHGEGLGERERYFGHVRYLNQQFIKVPFMMYLPGIKPGRVTVPVSLAGISPTLLGILGLQDGSFNHESLLALIKNKNRMKNRKPVYSFAYSPSAREDKLSVLSWPYQCIYSKDNTGKMNNEIYNLSLSQSFRKWDEVSPSVLVRHSRKDYLTLRSSFYQWNTVFNKSKLARAKPSSRREIEKLKTMGYVQ